MSDLIPGTEYVFRVRYSSERNYSSELSEAMKLRTLDCKLHVIYRTRRNFRGGLIFMLFAGEVDPRKLMRTKIKNYGPSP